MGRMKRTASGSPMNEPNEQRRVRLKGAIDYCELRGQKRRTSPMSKGAWARSAQATIAN